MSNTPKNTSRRDFLKSTTRLAAGSALAAAIGTRIYAAENNTINLALVGCGGRGTGAVADAFAAKGGPVKLIAMADVFEHRLKASFDSLNSAFADQVHVPEGRRFVGFDAYKKAIDCLTPGDVVILATHAAFRPLHFEYAVNKGVNIFAEKSFATDSPNVRRWLKAAKLSEKKNLKVAVGFMWRHSESREQVVQRIHNGAIGEVHTMRIYRVHGPVLCPPRSEGSEMAFQLQQPNSFTWVSSGFYIDWHCHNIDTACWVKGAWPVSAQGMGGRCYEQAGSQFDHYTVEYTFEDGAKLFTFSRHMDNCWSTYADYAHGSKGSAVIMATLGEPESKIYKSQKMTPENLVWQYGKKDPNPYHVEWQLLLDAIRQNKSYNEATRAGQAEIAALMGRAATHTGQYITWDQIANSNFQFVKDIDNLNFDTPAPIHVEVGQIYPPPQPGITKEC